MAWKEKNLRAPWRPKFPEETNPSFRDFNAIVQSLGHLPSGILSVEFGLALKLELVQCSLERYDELRGGKRFDF